MGSLGRKIKKAFSMSPRKAWSIFANNYLYVGIDKIGMKLAGVFCRGKLKDIIILESHNDFDSNGGAFYEYLLKEGYNRNYKIVWFLVNDIPKELPGNVVGVPLYKPSFKRWYYYNTAKYVLCCHYMLGSVKERQVSMYLTHGPFSLKNVKGLINIPQNMTYVLVSSKNFEEINARGLSMEYPSKRLQILGFPVHDVLYQEGKGDLSKITDKIFKNVILWMPTFRQTKFGRQDSETELPMGIPLIEDFEEYEKLNEILTQLNMLLIIKIHPMQDLTKIKIQSMSNIIILDGVKVKELNVDNYKLMKDADALISDYSSAAYDYLHLNRPIAYSVEDAESYKVRFIVDDPKELMAGPQLKTFDDLENFILSVDNGKDIYKEAREALLKRIFKYQDGNSSERIAEFLGLKK